MQPHSSPTWLRTYFTRSFQALVFCLLCISLSSLPSAYGGAIPLSDLLGSEKTQEFTSAERAQFNGSHDSLTIQSFFLADGGLNKNGGIDSFTLASGERIAASTLATLLPVTDTTTRPFAA